MSNILNDKVVGLSQLQEYDKQRQAHLPIELNELNKHTICTFNITSATAITLGNLTGMTEINWGDGTVDNKLSHTYTKIGEYTCVIKGVTSIGINAILAYTSLTSVIIGNSVTKIGSLAFSHSSLLTRVEIPNSVTSIGSSAFYNCSSLKSIEIPASVTSIGTGAFDGCVGLMSIEVKSKTPPKLFSNNVIPSTIEKIIVPIESINLYKEETNWVQYADKIVSIVDTNYLDSALANAGGASAENVEITKGQIYVGVPYGQEERPNPYVKITDKGVFVADDMAGAWSSFTNSETNYNTGEKLAATLKLGNTKVSANSNMDYNYLKLPAKDGTLATLDDCGGKTYYRHKIDIEIDKDPYVVHFAVISSSPTPVTNVTEFITLLNAQSEFNYPIFGVGSMTAYICSYWNGCIRSADGGTTVYYDVQGTESVTDIVCEL
jgi:hypothetical protein